MNPHIDGKAEHQEQETPIHDFPPGPGNRGAGFLDGFDIGNQHTGGAGVQADLQVFRSLGVHGAGVITALTVQDSGKVHQVLPAFPSVVLDQLRVLLRDICPNAVKIGMLATDDVARNVALGLE